MGRPRKKRKYTKRTHVTLQVDRETLADAQDAKVLIMDIKKMLIDADPAVARSAIRILLTDLTMVAKIVEGAPPAP